MKIKHIGVRITAYYSLVILIVILIISFSLSYIFRDEIIVQNNKIANNKIDIITYNIGTEVKNVKNLHNDITHDLKIRPLLYQASDRKYHSKELMNSLSRELINYKQKTPYIVNMFYVNSQNDIIDPLYNLDYYNKIIINNKEFEQYKKDKYRAKFSNPTFYPIKNNTTKDNIIYYGQVYEEDNYRLIGYLIINLKIEFLFSEIKDFCEEAFDETYIINENDEIIYSTGNNEMQDSIKDINKPVNNKKYFYNNQKKYFAYERQIDEYPLWRLVGINKYSTVMSNLTNLYKVVISIGLISIIIIIFVSFFIAKRITIPILNVSRAMKKFENLQWPVVIEPKSHDELRTLVSGFNKMVVNTKNLTYEIEKETEERRKVELDSLKFQLELLQSQINPHFIHNTLNSMQYLALKDGAHDVREMIQSLNLLLRASMSVGIEIVPLQQELKYLGGYINIQKNRFEDRFDFREDIDGDIENVKVPKLILQPLVENALYHGILPKEEKGSITVYITVDESVVFKIIDNGVGMDDDELKNIYNVNKTKKGGYNHIGLNNVNERLKLYYGNDCTLNISSDLGVGTCVIFEIPLSD
ncbi:histidine kinase [Vallitalea longa]|uniref:Histidine kinase n=1 Tax=Vallitalea longa TaxID=2936439 RepID=A0A9W6DDC3_9FIRM|nr:sensor histidine kinase [Vallitalea longa]GKX28576.1 histidine kinase [Vallitalea longa]